MDAYDSARPTYPTEAAHGWSASRPPPSSSSAPAPASSPRELHALGHGVVATDPDPAMLARLKRNLPEVSTIEAHAEELPVGDRVFDAVVAAQAFHWFDLDRALPETARVLKPGGRVGLVWNFRDETIPWVRRLGRLIGTQEQDTDPSGAITASGLFGEVEETRYTHWQQVDRRSIQDLVLSRSNVAVLDEDARAPSSPRWSPCTTSTDGAWTACGCRTSPAASGPPSCDRPGEPEQAGDAGREPDVRRHRHRHPAHRLPLSSPGP